MATPVPANNVIAPTSPSPSAVSLSANDLATLATDIYKCHDDVTHAWQHCIDRAMEAGDMLIKAKAFLGHGKFMSWLKDNCKIPGRSAERYMQFANNRQMIEEQMKFATVANLTIRQAERCAPLTIATGIYGH